MGRIYEAISKIEEERDRTVHPVKRPDGGAKANGQITRSNIKTGDEFDFLSYSLNLSPAQDANEAAPQGEAFSRPGREVELDFGRLDPHLVTLGDCDPIAAEAYHRLAAEVISAAIEHPLKRVLITSAMHGDGRTSVTLNLAGALALARRRVLIVDTDLLRPSVLRLLGVESDVGLAELLAGRAEPDEAIINLLPCSIRVLPTRGLVENSAELLASPDLGRLLESLDHDYDFILFDSAPLLASGDAHLLLHHVDTVLLVVSPGGCTAAQAAQATAMLASEDVFGVVLNKIVN
jgi:capsular exopolysaccharide synthesis family protein